jgi:WD40 repeat protein
MTDAPMPGSEPPLYFVCYSRRQRDFVAKVEAKLAARRRRAELDVWRDVRNLDVWEEFTEVIRAALERAAGAIVIISDAWYQSDYIQDHEWPTIKARAERDPWFKIFPLAFNDLDSHDPLRSRNFVNDLTDEILLHCSDAVRDRVLTRLSDLIGDHARSLHQRSVPTAAPSPATAVPVELVPPGGFEYPQPAGSVEVLDGVPELPGHFVAPAELDALAAQVAAGHLIAVTGLQGEGGTGKSVLAAAVAHRTAHLFSGGVHWVTVGERATSEDVRQLQAGLLSRLGGGLDHAPRDITEGREMLMAALAGRAALLVVDDVWHPWHTRAFDVSRAGEQVRVLFTTRFPEALPAGSAATQMARLGRHDAEEFLGRLHGGLPGAAEDLDAVLDAAGGLRLALAVLAATAAVEGSWMPVLSRLKGLADRFGHGDDASSAQKALYVALDTLDADDRNLALRLGAFPADASVPVDLLAELWDVPLTRANQLVDRLAAKDLVTCAEDRVVLHDHAHDFLVLESRTPASDVHLRLWELAQEKRRRGWGAFADDSPYLWDRLAWHACRAGLNRRTLWEFVSDVDWLAHRIRRQGASAAEQDVGRVCDATALSDTAPLSRLRRVLRHGGLFEAASAGAGLGISLTAWADVVGLTHRARRRLHGGSLPVPSSGLLQTLRGHSSESWGVAFSRAGRRLITCAEDGTTRVWDTRTGQSLMTLTDHTKQVWRLAVSPDDRLLATAGADMTARLWDTETGTLVRTLPKHRRAVWGVAFSHDGQRLATSSEDGLVRIWHVPTGRSLVTLDGRPKPLWDVDFSPDGTHVATAGADGTIGIWDSNDGGLLHSLHGHSGPVRAVTFSPDGRHLLTGSDDRTGRLWDVRTGASVHTLTGHGNPVWSVAFSPDGNRVATGSEDGTARTWDVQTGAPMLTLTGHTSSVHDVAFSPDGRRLATVGGDGTARVWDTTEDRGVGALTRLAGEVHDVVLGAGNTRLLTAVGDRTVRIWDIATSEPVLTLSGPDGPVWGVAWSPDEQLVAGSSEDGATRIWDARTGGLRRTLTGHRSQVWDVQFSRDGRRLATASEDRTARLWDARTGKRLAVLRGHRGRLWEVAFSSDDRRLATGGDDGTARVWDTDTGAELLTLEGHGGSVWDLAFSTDDRLLATASEDGKARIWDTETRQVVHVLAGHTSQVWGVTFSSDNRYLATASGDGTVRIWNCGTGECLLTLAVACSGPIMWNGPLLAIAAGASWAVIDMSDLGD